MKRHPTLPFLYSILVLFSYNVVADLKIGYVNIELALKEEVEYKNFLVELDSEQKKNEQAELKARAEIEAEMAKFSKLGDKAKQEQQIALGKKIEALQAQFHQQKTELERKYQAKHAEFINKNQLISDAISKERKLDYTLNSMGIAFVSDAQKKNDITPELIKRYNKAYAVAPAAPEKKSTKKSDKAKP